MAVKTVNTALAEHLMESVEDAMSDDRLNRVCEYFRCMVNGMQDQVMVIDRDYRVRDVNSAFLRQMGYTRGEVIGRRCYEVVYQLCEPRAELEVVCPLHQVWEKGEPIRASHVLRGLEERPFFFDVSAFPLHDEQGQVAQIIAICHDVTAERRLEAKLAAIGFLSRELVLSREKSWIAQAVVNAAEHVLEFQLCHLWLIDEEGKELVCQAYAPADEPPKISRLPIDGARGITTAVAHSGEAIYLPDVSREARYVSAHSGTRSELCVPLKAGEQVIGVLNAESARLDAFGQDDRQLFSILADQAALAIENARLFEIVGRQGERLRALAMRLAEAEETERQRLARELHDQVGRNLTALSINLSYVRMQMTGEAVAPLRSRLEDSLALVGQTGLCIRNVMADLRPPVLDNHGIVAALRWYGAQVASRVGVAVGVQGEEPAPRLSTLVETALFRIAQEALTNVAKYAQATQVTVTLETDSSTVRLTVADSGIGFDPAHLAVPEDHHGWGLLSMAERARAVGGHCHVESRPGHGTRVVVEVPR